MDEYQQAQAEYQLQCFDKYYFHWSVVVCLLVGFIIVLLLLFLLCGLFPGNLPVKAPLCGVRVQEFR